MCEEDAAAARVCMHDGAGADDRIEEDQVIVLH